MRGNVFSYYEIGGDDNSNMAQVLRGRHHKIYLRWSNHRCDHTRGQRGSTLLRILRRPRCGEVVSVYATYEDVMMRLTVYLYRPNTFYTSWNVGTLYCPQQGTLTYPLAT